MTENKEAAKSNKSSLKKAGILIGGIAVVAAAGAASWFYFFRSTPGQKLSPFRSAQLVPDEALVTSYIYTDTKAWSQLQNFGTPELKNLVEENQQKAQQEIWEGSDITFQEDIQPWVGGIMLAYMPSGDTSTTNPEDSQSNSPRDSANGNAEPTQAETAPAPGSALFVVGIKNKTKALDFFSKMQDREGTQVQETDYQGVTIFELTQPEETNYFARLGNHLLLSPKRQNVERAIDTSKGEASFADSDGAVNVLQQGTKVNNPIAQVYITDYSKLVRELSANSPDAPQLSEGTIAQLQNIKHIVAGVGVDGEGIRMRFLSQIDPSNLPEGYQQQSPGEVLKRFPQDTIALISGIGINRVWSQLQTQAEENPEVQQFVEQIRSALQSVNLNADEVFGWMDGEFGVASVPLASNTGLFGQVGMGLAVVMQTSDRDRAESTLQKIQDVAKQQAPFLSFGEKQVGDIKVTEWQVPAQGALLGHGWLDENSVFVALGNGLPSSFVESGAQNLSDSSQFQEVTNTLPQSNVGYFYLNMDKMVSILNNIPRLSNNGGIPPETRAVLDSMNGVGVTANWQNQSTSQLEMLFSLKETSEVNADSGASPSPQPEN
ncbi:DUF3352 domain-containing protein [Geitlerinema sp. PCC 9228]|jgi:hypothetical protein|uniref:DUF3352 domain-containing protein n=1 Tax=Geitlerinema sp. PCC 9228 TaxID=111611 RepID=UPI0009FE4ED6|nr:DUF3352 domain-containing protein [Geitlerinema sp. PCC 9228]